MSVTLRYAGSEVYIDPSQPYVRTTFKCCGVYVEARSQYGDEDKARAASLGYDGVEACTLEHDPLHSWLARVLGLSCSPTLEALAHGREHSPDLVQAEEAVILGLQAFLNALKRHGYPVDHTRCP